MIKRLYALTGFLLFKAALPLVRIFFTVRPSSRTRVIVMNGNYQVLLIKGWFSYQRWELPGGGIHSGEPPVRAARRELYEETGVQVTESELTFLGSFKHVDTRTPYIVELFLAKIDHDKSKTPLKYRWEILEQQWFPIENLPQNISPLVSRSIKTLDRFEK